MFGIVTITAFVAASITEILLEKVLATNTRPPSGVTATPSG
jgi:hypothetical protein